MGSDPWEIHTLGFPTPWDITTVFVQPRAD